MTHSSFFTSPSYACNHLNFSSVETLIKTLWQYARSGSPSIIINKKIEEKSKSFLPNLLLLLRKQEGELISPSSSSSYLSTSSNINIFNSLTHFIYLLFLSNKIIDENNEKNFFNLFFSYFKLKIIYKLSSSSVLSFSLLFLLKQNEKSGSSLILLKEFPLINVDVKNFLPFNLFHNSSTSSMASSLFPFTSNSTISSSSSLSKIISYRLFNEDLFLVFDSSSSSSTSIAVINLYQLKLKKFFMLSDNEKFIKFEFCSLSPSLSSSVEEIFIVTSSKVYILSSKKRKREESHTTLTSSPLKEKDRDEGIEKYIDREKIQKIDDYDRGEDIIVSEEIKSDHLFLLTFISTCSHAKFFLSLYKKKFKDIVSTDSKTIETSLNSPSSSPTSPFIPPTSPNINSSSSFISSSIPFSASLSSPSSASPPLSPLSPFATSPFPISSPIPSSFPTSTTTPVSIESTFLFDFLTDASSLIFLSQKIMNSFLKFYLVYLIGNNDEKMMKKVREYLHFFIKKSFGNENIENPAIDKIENEKEISIEFSTKLLDIIINIEKILLKVIKKDYKYEKNNEEIFEFDESNIEINMEKNKKYNFLYKKNEIFEILFLFFNLNLLFYDIFSLFFQYLSSPVFSSSTFYFPHFFSILSSNHLDFLFNEFSLLDLKDINLQSNSQVSSLPNFQPSFLLTLSNEIISSNYLLQFYHLNQILNKEQELLEKKTNLIENDHFEKNFKNSFFNNFLLFFLFFNFIQLKLKLLFYNYEKLTLDHEKLILLKDFFANFFSVSPFDSYPNHQFNLSDRIGYKYFFLYIIKVSLYILSIFTLL